MSFFPSASRAHPEKRYSVGIDFGTWSSGFAYLDLDRADESPVPFVQTHWPGVEPGQAKTRTCVILNERDELADAVSGAGAQCFEWRDSQNARLLRQDSQFREHFVLHEKFKLHILGQGDDLWSVTGHSLDVEIVVSEFLKWMLRQVLQTLRLQDQSPIVWVFTIPPIYEDREKALMLRACQRAGYRTDAGDLLFAHEPEAAALWAIRDAIEERGARVDRLFPKFDSEDIVIILDAGLRLSEMTASSSNSMFGAAQINEQMCRYLELKSPVEYQKVWNDEETRVEFLAAVELGKITFRNQIGVTIRVGSASFSIPKEDMMGFFQPSLKAIEELLNGQYDALYVDEIQHLICVGGLCCSDVVFRFVQDTFGSRVTDRNIRRPRTPRNAVALGASLYGLVPDGVAERLSRVTYGIAERIRFCEHNEEHIKRGSQIIHVDGVPYLPNFFRSLIEKGENVKEDSVEWIGDYSPQPRIEIGLYRSEKSSVCFVDQPGGVQVRLFVIELTPAEIQRLRSIQLLLRVGKVRMVLRKVLLFSDGQRVEEDIPGEIPLHLTGVSSCFEVECGTCRLPKWCVRTPCSHLVCQDCILADLGRDDGHTTHLQLECPEPGCTVVLDEKWFMSIPSGSVYRRVGVVLTRKFLLTCPRCQVRFRRPRTTFVHASCPNFHDFCLSCFAEWVGEGNCHNPACPTRANRLAWLDLKPEKVPFVFKSDRDRPTGSIFRQRLCPRCGNLVRRETNDKCKHVECPVCSLDFCIICLAVGDVQGRFPCGGAWHNCGLVDKQTKDPSETRNQ